MELIKQYKISCDSDLIFAKNDLKNFFKYKNFLNSSFFLFALMELGTNILKYPKKGEIWLLKEENDFLLAALDRGEGIEDIDWALKKGTSSKKTLGLGLYQLSQNDKYKLEILSLKSKYIHGSVILIRPKKEKNIVYLTKNYLDLPYGGDFVLEKGKYIILGDVSGHGRKAYLSALKIKNFIMSNIFSCLLIDEFFEKLHIFIEKNDLRGVVLSILEISKFGVNICGVGSNKIFVKENDINVYSFKEGILGEAFSSAAKFKFDSFKEIFVTTDGIERNIMYNILKETDSIYLSVIGGIFFSEEKDDKTLIGVSNGL